MLQRELIAANTRDAWPLPGRRGGRKAAAEPDYRCAAIDGLRLSGDDEHTAGGDSVMEDRHMVTLRSAAPPDAGGVARVHVRSWQAAYRGLLPADFLTGLQPADWAAGYTFDAQDPATTVAVDSRSGIVGFATVSIAPPLARLMAMYVDPDLWGHGVGSQLLKQAMDSFRTAGCTVAELWVMTATSVHSTFTAHMDGTQWPPTSGKMSEGSKLTRSAFRRRFDGSCEEVAHAPEI